MSRHSIRHNITNLQARVGRCSQKSQFRQGDVLLLAVSKTRSAEEIRQACESGLSHFGESYLQEALPKMEALAGLPLTWHFIGPLQSNKTRAVAEHFHWVHSVDRDKIARRLDAQRPAALPPLEVCLQVNVSGEDSKSGVDEARLEELAATVVALPRLRLRGLMAIPAASRDEAVQRRAFGRLRELLWQLQERWPELDTLSMGMSGDFEAALAEGATIVRLGTAVFGPRDG